VLLDMLRDGRLHLSGIVRLLPVLTRENRDALLAQATHRSKSQILELVAELNPRPDVPARMRKLPQDGEARSSLSRSASAARVSPSSPPDLPLMAWPGGALATPGMAGAGGVEPLCPDTVGAASDLAPAPAPVVTRPESQVGAEPCPSGVQLASPTRWTVVEPLSPGRYRVQFTASAELHDRLERLRALMRMQVPDGDLAAIIDQAVREKLERLEARRYAKARAPRKGLSDTDIAPATRHVPAAVRRAVRERNGDRCGFVDAEGRRCSERYRLEFHHRHPFGMGGDHAPSNLGLLCRAHNQLLARSDYGALAASGQGKTRAVLP
jgi:hypothetical protein